MFHSVSFKKLANLLRPARAIAWLVAAVSTLSISTVGCKLATLSSQKTVKARNTQGQEFGAVPVPVQSDLIGTGICVYQITDVSPEGITQFMQRMQGGEESRSQITGATLLTKNKMSLGSFKQQKLLSEPIKGIAPGLINRTLVMVAAGSVLGTGMAANLAVRKTVNTAKGVANAVTPGFLKKKKLPPGKAYKGPSVTLGLELVDDQIPDAQRMLDELVAGLARQVEVYSSTQQLRGLSQQALLKNMASASGNSLDSNGIKALSAAIDDPNYGAGITSLLKDATNPKNASKSFDNIAKSWTAAAKNNKAKLGRARVINKLKTSGNFDLIGGVVNKASKSGRADEIFQGVRSLSITRTQEAKVLRSVRKSHSLSGHFTKALKGNGADMANFLKVNSPKMAKNVAEADKALVDLVQQGDNVFPRKKGPLRNWFRGKQGKAADEALEHANHLKTNSYAVLDNGGASAVRELQERGVKQIDEFLPLGTVGDELAEAASKSGNSVLTKGKAFRKAGSNALLSPLKKAFKYCADLEANILRTVLQFGTCMAGGAITAGFVDGALFEPATQGFAQADTNSAFDNPDILQELDIETYDAYVSAVSSFAADTEEPCPAVGVSVDDSGSSLSTPDTDLGTPGGDIPSNTTPPNDFVPDPGPGGDELPSAPETAPNEETVPATDDIFG